MNALAPNRLNEIAEEIRLSLHVAGMRAGALLVEAREIFRYDRNEGGFAGWLDANFAFSKSTAYRMMRIAEQVGSDNLCEFGTLSSDAALAIAGPDTPAEVRQEVTERLDAGEKVTADEIERLSAENAALKGDLSKLQERDRKNLKQITRLTGKLRDAREEPAALTVQVDMEPLWDALVALWTKAPMALRERFFETYRTPFAAPRIIEHTDSVAEGIDSDVESYHEDEFARPGAEARPGDDTAASSTDGGSDAVATELSTQEFEAEAGEPETGAEPVSATLDDVKRELEELIPDGGDDDDTRSGVRVESGEAPDHGGDEPADGGDGEGVDHRRNGKAPAEGAAPDDGGGETAAEEVEPAYSVMAGWEDLELPAGFDRRGAEA